MNDKTAFNHALELWFSQHQRQFPWRENRNPYYVWISEIMSQQTQIQRVADGFFPRFIAAFPTVEQLAKATWEEVFPLWEGLGYYNRGKNLLKAARLVVEKHEGELPQTAAQLEALPGIGRYTAHAILAFAFDQKVPAMDTNVSKIMTVLWPEEDPVKLAHELVAASSSGFVWNSALMDLASALRAGEVIEGPLGEHFFSDPALRARFQPQRKAKAKSKGQAKAKRKHRIEVGIACIWREGKYLIQARPKGKSFEGSWEFPGGKREKGESFRECVKREIEEEVGVKVSVRPHFYESRHEFEKTELVLRFHRCQIQSGEPQSLEEQPLKWVRPEEFDQIDFLKTNHTALEKLKAMRL